MKRATLLLACAPLALAPSSPGLAAIVEIGATADTTLYEDPAGQSSNGSGQHFFAGLTAMNAIRRGLIRFDVASAVPPGSKIDGVTLELHMSKTIVGVRSIWLHRALADWGEGTSDAPGEEGAGTAAAPGDATWLHTFFPSEFWNDAGGDFERVPSAETQVEDVGDYTWSSTAMAADVQLWVDRPELNFGWAVVGREGGFNSSKRFDTREHPDAAARPVLTIEFTSGEPPDGDGVPASSGLAAALAAALVLVVTSAILLRTGRGREGVEKVLGTRRSTR